MEAATVRIANELVEMAVAARKEAEAAEARYSSAARWREAEAYAALASEPYSFSFRAIAERCGTNRRSASVFVRMVAAYPDCEQRPTFWHAYKEISGPGGSPLAPRTPRTLEGRLDDFRGRRRSLVALMRSEGFDAERIAAALNVPPDELKG